jgi:TP901 family phage tail tape measure protein
MTRDAMGTIQYVLEKVNSLPKDKRLSAMTLVFGKEFGDDAAKLANNLPELQRQLKLTQAAMLTAPCRKNLISTKTLYLRSGCW